MRGRRRLRVDSAAKDAVPSPAGTHSTGSGVAPTSPAERRRVSLRRRARSRSPKTEAEPDGMEWERNNTVRLIELIRARPCLWDASSRRYTERHCRRDALADVARTLGVSLLCVQKKWTNLRTQYFRERTRLQTVPGHCPRWFGFNMMRFLEDGPIGQHARSSSVGSSGMVVEVVDDDSRADSCWATSSVDCGDSNRDPDDVEIVIEQAPFIKRQVKDPFDEDDEETRSNAPTPTPQIELQMPPATPPPAPPREATPTPTPPSPPPQKRLRSQAARAAQQQLQQQQLQQQQQQQQKQQQQQPQPSTSGATLRQPQVEAVPQPNRHIQQPHRDTEPPRPPLIGRTVPPPPPAANEPQRDYSPPPAAAVRGTKRRVEVVDPMTIPSTSTAAPSLAVIAEPPEEVHATLHDRLDMYALHVASRLRQIQDPYIRSVAINKIDNALFSAATNEMVQQRNAAHAAPAAPVHHRAPPPPAPATAANVHFPAANPHQAFPGLHAMGTYHQAPSMQANHLSSVISDMQEEYIEELESKNLMVRLT